jgi:polyphenol oxidase
MHINGFILRESAVPYYACTALERDPWIRHGFSTRRGGVSGAPPGKLNLGFVPWDSAANVRENRQRFLSALGLEIESLATVSQIHSADFHIINGVVHQWNPRTPGDALVTADRNVALAVLVADCFPVLILDRETGAIAAVHAGWRGTLARIVRRTIEGMHQELGCRPSNALVAIGPGIRSCCFEVGPEVSLAFDSAYPGASAAKPHSERPGKQFLDLPLALRNQLAEAGVPAENIFDLGLCTRCRPDEFFSYRAEGNHAGRMMAVIGRK